ncbi:MAG: substrate-binding domain-containing protein [Lachnospiraceae bacterium]|nr:substrate-binding domain-containing protein [Lachnospiraceae bacterium]
MKKKVFALLCSLTLVAGLLIGCTGDDTSDTTTDVVVEDTAAEDTADAGETQDAAEGPFDITVIIKATDSDYWQILASGALAAAEQSDGMIRVTIDGPPSELDIAQQVTIFENAIQAGPDGIVIAATSGETVVNAVEEATAAGIPVVALDEYIPSGDVVTFLATDHAAASAETADLMVAQWESEGIDPSGMDVVVISAVAGAGVNVARTNGFIDRIQELVPDINVLETQYADNDIARATDIAGNLIAANPNLIGIFGDNNHMGVGIALAIEETGRQDIITYAFDANQQQVDAIQAGNLTGMVVQDPWGMGFNGVLDVVRAIQGEGASLPASVAVPVNVVTAENINDADIQELLSQHIVH